MSNTETLERTISRVTQAQELMKRMAEEAAKRDRQHTDMIINLCNAFAHARWQEHQG